jgi:hypothetical protein
MLRVGFRLRVHVSVFPSLLLFLLAFYAHGNFFRYPIVATDGMMLIIPPAFFHLVGLFSTVCISNLMPLYYAVKWDAMINESATYEQFISLLLFPSFRYKSRW